MDDRLKQRLIGAIVLVALAVIFIPMILDGGHEKTLPAFGKAIPEKPAVLKKLEEVVPAPLETPARPDMIERQLVDNQTGKISVEASSDQQTTTPVGRREPKKLAEEQKATVSAKGSKAWVVQIGSFESRKNALALRDKLRKHKYRAFVETVKNNNSWNYRVRIGPEVRRSTAESLQKDLLRKLKINGVVMGHP